MHTLRSVVMALVLVVVLASCAMLPGLPTFNVRWVDSAVHLAVFLDMTPLPVPLEDEDGAEGVTHFTGTADVAGSFTINGDVVCEFELAAEAAYALDLEVGTFLSGFSGSYGADGEGFNVPADCTYETYALFEWVFEFEVTAPVTMQVVASLFAAVVPPVVGEQLHYILVRQKDAAEPLWIGESEEGEVDADFDESIGLQPGTYEFAVYARPLLHGVGGIASLVSGWTYAVTFENVE